MFPSISLESCSRDRASDRRIEFLFMRVGSERLFSSDGRLIEGIGYRSKPLSYSNSEETSPIIVEEYPVEIANTGGRLMPD